MKINSKNLNMTSDGKPAEFQANGIFIAVAAVVVSADFFFHCLHLAVVMTQEECEYYGCFHSCFEGILLINPFCVCGTFSH